MPLKQTRGNVNNVFSLRPQESQNREQLVYITTLNSHKFSPQLLYWLGEIYFDTNVFSALQSFSQLFPQNRETNLKMFTVTLSLHIGQ